MLCPGFLALTVGRRDDAARAFTIPWGTEGDKVEVTAAQGAADGRNQAFFVLMGGAGLVGEAPCAGKILRRTAVQRGLDRFPVMGGLGGDKKIAGRSRAIPLFRHWPYAMARLPASPAISATTEIPGKVVTLWRAQTPLIMHPTPAIDKHIAPLFRTTGEKPLLFTLELELLGAPLPIKRVLKIPSNMNLGYVQEVLMLAMGWEGYHLKEIRHGNYTYFVRLAGGQDPEPVEGFPQRDSFKYTLGDLLKEEWDSFIFVYDLGDAWKHRVTLLDIAPCKEEDAKEDSVAAYLVSGENACPPEDVGGVDGYADALKSFNDPEDDEYDHIRQWMGEDFDPHLFDLRVARRRVDDFQRTIGEARWGFYHQ